MIAVTDLQTYLLCPYALYLEKVMKVKPPPTPNMVRGKIIHKIEEIIGKKNDGILALIGPHQTEKEISELLYENWKRILKREVLRKREELERAGEDYLAFIKELKHAYRNEAIVAGIRLRQAPLGERVLFETLIEEKIEDAELGMRGIVDRIEIYDGHHIPVEMKTGVPRLLDIYRIQLAAYVMLCEKRFCEKIPFGFIVFLSLGDKIPIFVEEPLREKVIETKKGAEKVLDGFIPERIKRKECENCKYFNYCFCEQ